MSSKWQQTTTALKNKAGAIEGAIDKRVSTAQEKLSEFIYEEEEGAHRVSDYKWRRAMFQFRGTLHHGIPAGPTCIAFDPVQRLMAVGTDKGLVKLFGKPGVEVVVNQYAGSITHLCFLVNMGKLVLVHRGGSCEGVNLDSRRSIGSYVFKGAVVTCLVHVPNTDFVCVGLDTGHVHVLSAAGKLALSSYRISGRSALGSKPSAVAGLMLIAHECGTINEWDLNKETSLLIYPPYQSPAIALGSLTTICWHPQDDQFATGYRSGDLLVWKRGQSSAPLATYVMSEHPNTPRRPIKRMVWTTFLRKNFLCTLGGTSMSHEPDSVAIRYERNFLILPTKGDDMKSAVGLVDMALARQTAFPFSVEPWSIIGVTTNSDITVFNPDYGRFHYVLPSPTFQLQSSQVTCTLFSNVDKGFLNNLSQCGDFQWSSHGWPLMGGSSSAQPHISTDILVTGHANGRVFFWDMSNTHFNLIYEINLLTDVADISKPSVVSLDLCVTSRILAVSCASGETMLYNFARTPGSLTRRQVELHVEAQREMVELGSIFLCAPTSTTIPVTPSPHVSPPSHHDSPVSPVKKRVEEERKSSPLKSMKSSRHSGSAGEFSWTLFFINAKVDEDTARKYAAFFDGEKITEDLVRELDQDMMEMAGITSVGDRMRIMKYVKSGYSRNDCLNGASGSEDSERSERSSKKKSKKKSSTSKKKSRSVEAKASPKTKAESPKMEAVHTPPVATVSIPPPVIPSMPPTPLEKPPGYQLKADCSFRNRVTQIRIASALSKVAVGDRHGNVALLDITTGRILLHKALGEERRAPVSWLCFDDRAVVEKEMDMGRTKRARKTRKQRTEEPGLFVGLADGRLFYIALRTGQVDAITVQGAEENESVLSSILLLEGTGAPVIPEGISWETLLSESVESNEATPSRDMDEEEVELVIRNLDEEHNAALIEAASSRAPLAEAAKQELSPQEGKYLLVCAGNVISIYSLPNYRLYSSCTCDETPQSANVVERDGGNYCLVVFHASGDVQIFTLMDLLEIKTVPKALQEIGVQFSPTKLRHDMNCTTDGRFVILTKYQEVVRGSLFADENLLGLPYSLPKLHVPELPISPEEESRADSVYNVSEYNRLYGTVGNVKVQEATPAAGAARGMPVRSRGDSPNDARRPSAPGPAGNTGPIKRVTPQTANNNRFNVSDKIRGTVGSAVGDVKDIMNQNFEALAVRREKLEEMLVASDQVASKANTFAGLAEEMAHKEKNRKWWQ